MNYLPELTVRYKTYLKTALVEGLQGVFSNHLDIALRDVRVTVDFPRTQAAYPAVVIRFYERNVFNAGIGHREIIQDENGDNWIFKHYFYRGDVEFSIYALSSWDRDLISDTLIQTIGMGDLNSYTNRFLARIWPDDDGAVYPDALAHFININTDEITGFGENTSQVPWESEDDLIYSTSYRCAVFGEFYNPPPQMPVGLITKVNQYPYIAGVEDVPQGTPGDGAPWNYLDTIDNELLENND